MARVVVDTFEDGVAGQPYIKVDVSGGGTYDTEAAFGSLGLRYEPGESGGLFLEPDGDRPALGVGGYHKVVDNGLGVDASATVGWDSRVPGSLASGLIVAIANPGTIQVFETDASGDYVRADVVATFPSPTGWVHMWARGGEWRVETLGGGTIASGTFLSTPDTAAAWSWSAGSDIGSDGYVYIDNPYYWPAVVPVVRQYPRDDEYGYSSGRRTYPPPRLARIIGSQS